METAGQVVSSDPFSSIAGAIGIVGSVVGSVTSMYAQSGVSASNQQTLKLELEAERVRMEAMEVQGKAQQMSALREFQRASALGLTNATTSGMGLGGSALYGGRGEIAGRTNENVTGVYNALQTGRALFDINSRITASKVQAAEYAGMAATGAGLTSLGGGILGALPAIRGLSGYMGSNKGTGVNPYTGVGGTSGSELY